MLQELDALHVSLQRLMDHVVQGLVLQVESLRIKVCVCLSVRSVCVCVCV